MTGLTAIALTLAASSIAFVPTLGAQDSTSAAAPGVISGRVTDTLGTAVSNVIVDIVSEGTAADSIRVQARDDGSFVVSKDASHSPFRISARAVGFTPLVAHHMKVDDGDTLRVTLRLLRSNVTLSQVNVKGTRGSALASRSITAADFNPKHYYDALMLLANARPKMLGDLDRCPPVPGAGDSVVVDKIFINGVRRDVPIPPKSKLDTQKTAMDFHVVKVPNTVSEGVVQVLERLMPGDIAEMRLVDCQSSDFDATRRNALYVVLKPGKKYR